MLGYRITATYLTIILTTIGIADPFIYQIMNSVVAFLGYIIGANLYDLAGRRRVLIPGLFAVALLDFVCGGMAFTGLTTPTQGKAFAAMCILFSFVAQVTFSRSVLHHDSFSTL